MTKEELYQLIDNNVYENQDGEITGESLNAVLKAIVDDGGTEVEANPTGEPTETLEKLKIGETIYTAPQGPQGEPGTDGQPGAPGPANTLSIGTVTNGEQAAASITGNAPNQQLNLVLPQGEPGTDGQPGAPGPANTLSIGTVTNGEQAAASITGNAPNQQLNLVLPKGEQGDPGQNAVNPFKGWVNDVSDLPANPHVGDYAYVKGVTASDPVAIYECTTAGSWSNSGRTFNPANNQEFASGQDLNTVNIVDNLETNVSTDVLSAKQGKIIGDSLNDVRVEIYGAGEVAVNIDSYISSADDYTYIDSSGKWEHENNTGVIIPATVFTTKGRTLKVVGSIRMQSKIAYLKSNTKTIGQLADFCDGYNNRISIIVGDTYIGTIPTDCNYIWFAVGTTTTGNETAYFPMSTKVVLEGDTSIISNIEFLKSNQSIDVDFSNFESSTYYYIDESTGEWIRPANTNNQGGFLKLVGKFTTIVVEGNTLYKSKIAFLKSRDGNTPDYCQGETGRHDIEVGETETFSIPSDCKYIWFATGALTPNVYKPKKATLYADYSNILSESTNESLYSRKNGSWYGLTAPNLWKYVRVNSQESIPIGTSAVDYATFIGYWDSFVQEVPSDVTVVKSSVTVDTMNTATIYKYVFTPGQFKKTIFLTAGMHGDEYEGFWGLLRMMQYIYSHGNDNDIIGYIRHNFRIVVIPVLNPYGVNNRKRYSTNTTNDQNYNFDVDWSTYSPHTGNTPFYYKEPLAVKLVCDDYNDIIFHIDYHTDPYSPTKANYIEANEGSIIFGSAYNLTIDERKHIEDTFDYHSIDTSFVVWTNTAATSFRYMEVTRYIPSIVVECAVNGYAQSGTAEQMKAAVDWYINCLCMMTVNVL